MGRRFDVLISVLAFAVPALAAPNCLMLLQDPKDVKSADFPASEHEMHAIAQGAGTKRSHARLRSHAWRLLRLVTEPVHPGCPQPIFESWPNRAAAFSGPRQESNKSTERPLFRSLQITQKLVLQGTPATLGRTFSTAYFNRSTVSTLQLPARDLSKAATLIALWKKLPSSQDSIQFERSSIVVKPVWRVIPRAEGAICLGVWDSEKEVRGEGGVPEKNWKRQVVVKHPSPLGEVKFPVDCGSPSTTQTVPASLFYSAVLTNSDELPKNLAGQPGDMLILLGLHIITKEMPDWIWSTYWWHPEPAKSSFGADGRAKGLKAPWRNYRMDVTISEEMRSDPFVQGFRVIFNPYLEAALPPLQPGSPGGTSSNCISCHSRAVWPRITLPLEPAKVTRGLQPPQFFAKRLKLDFLWSLVLHKRN